MKTYHPPLILVRNEEPAGDGGEPVKPEDVVITDQNGRPVTPNAGEAPLAPEEQQHPGLSGARIENASATLATMTDVRLTSYIAGYRPLAPEQLAEFIAPRVPAAIKYDFLKADAANAFAVQQRDEIGMNGLPAVVRMDPQSTQSGTLKWRGLETPFTKNERDIASSIPGGSVAREENRRVRFLRRLIGAGYAQRVLAAMVNALGSATSVSWASTVNPIESLDDYIIQVLDVIGGGRENVRVLFGSSAWKTLKYHEKISGGTNYRQQRVTLQWVADMLEMPRENLMVSYHQAVSVQQGRTTAKSRIFTAAEVLIFACSPQPTEDDPSFMKTFAMPNDNGQWFTAYRWNPHPFVENLGLAYYEDVQAVMSSAAKRLTITT